MAAKKNRAKARKIALGVLIGYVLIMAIGYMGVAFYYSDHFLKGTVINGIDCENMTAEDVKEKIQEGIGEYQLELVKIDGGTEIITADQIGLQYVDDNKVDELLKSQNRWAWITAFADDKTYELAANTTYDQSSIDGLLDAMSCFQEANIEAPQDAKLEFDGTQYVITPEVVGNTLDREKVKAAVVEAIDSGKTQLDLDEAGCYLKPSVYQDDENLITERDQLNQFLKTNITYDFGDRSETVDASLIKDWIVKGDDGQYTVDEDKVMEYVKQLAYKYDTFGLAHDFTTSHGEKIRLERGGDYGWVMKKQETADQLVEYIREGKTGTVEPVYLYEGKSRDTNDIGGTYVEISIEEQRMWCYKDGQLIVDTPVVTGNPNKGWETPAGCVWAIDAKKQNAVLTGEGYTQPVTYWLPFNGNVGIHDADTWRSEYGGEIYKTSGSHGCVNTPTENARKIFEAVEIGTPVIVY